MTDTTLVTTWCDDLVDRSLTWFTNNIEWFDPLRSTAFPHPASRFSPLLELLHLRRLLDLRGRLFRSPASQGFAEATRLLARRVAPGLQSLVGPSPSAFYLSWLGLEVAATTEAGTSAHLRMANGADLERQLLPAGPYSDLEHAYVQSSFARDPSHESRSNLFSRWLSSRNYQHSITSDQCYELTHAVFYLSDFGLAQPCVPHRAALASLATRMLRASLDSDQLDLAAELLLTVSIVDPSYATLTEHGWSRLRDAQQPTGAVTGPLFNPTWYKKQTQEELSAYIAATCYHTTLATCIAATAYADRHGKTLKLGASA